MDEVLLEINDEGEGKFYIQEDGEQIGQMVFAVNGNVMTVFHTDVEPKGQGKGLSKKMLEAMVAYVRKNHLQVKPLCTFVHTQFRRHPQDYIDIWNPQGK